MIAPLLCLLLPALDGCTRYADHVPSIAQIERDRQEYDGKTVDVSGRVHGLNQWHSRTAESFVQTFFICEQRDCIHVFVESHSPVRNGERVSVRGAYYREYRSRKSVFRNEIEASEVLAAQ